MAHYYTSTLLPHSVTQLASQLLVHTHAQKNKWHESPLSPPDSTTKQEHQFRHTSQLSPHSEEQRREIKVESHYY